MGASEVTDRGGRGGALIRSLNGNEVPSYFQAMCSRHSVSLLDTRRTCSANSRAEGKSWTESTALGPGAKRWMELKPMWSGTEALMNAWKSFSVT